MTKLKPFNYPSESFTLEYLADISGAELVGVKQHVKMTNTASLEHANNDEISFLHNKKYLPVLKLSQAGACIIAPAYQHHAPDGMSLLLHDNPYKGFALIMQAFYRRHEERPFISDSAYIHDSAVVDASCKIEPGAYIGKQAVIGKNTQIGVNSYIGDGVQIGDDCVIENNVSISFTIMGKRNLIHPGARIGQDGFGFASDKDGHYKIPHTGGVLIGNDVEIGANSCIDRGSVHNTVIEDMCRIDNLVQIGHNVQVGYGSVLVAQVGIAGSSKLGRFVTLAGQVGVIGHLTIGDGATVLSKSGVFSHVEKNGRVAGYPAIPALRWKRQVAWLKRLLLK